MNIFNLNKDKRDEKTASTKLYDTKKIFEIANLVPVDYAVSDEDKEFLENAKDQFKEIINNTHIDDFCDDMLDKYIDSRINEMKVSACDQYAQHMATISHHEGLLKGELIRANQHLANLRSDLCGLDQALDSFVAIRKQKYAF